ncbi:hypothetical protein PNOK_0318800 [Pyrrhoderma noxium]|uniref:Uncharacterized protein n=1 Tax=Pyrrhoderma noxium TaxID=2282107 RepID=A0A286ULS3_9AGAM|nr:hypothetical protein PNOK_0318800 [Pyrrhoderma noxium]
MAYTLNTSFTHTINTRYSISPNRKFDISFHSSTCPSILPPTHLSVHPSVLSYFALRTSQSITHNRVS